MDYSKRAKIAKEVDGWYEENPEAERSTTNTVSVLVNLGYIKEPWMFDESVLEAIRKDLQDE